ncbi:MULTISPECIES: glycoside hydrolase family 3 C-terminal domain-containing protein [unclassified Streptomyces]|uniref:glycoside hydrolase family 3 C-terminal domain-containing protein n=1 Tax=unclassified Streptomyces TaxID=2593676 RepID=UPI002ED62E74|nr:glycoside hydrolase family 3 C-terminal domain-containing protein [Streptomyces sp. NBC_00891]WSY08697.1 glycoside hydrolase family 3 C-terminal domain-containing protein [Streptomyces sp. NBC_00890]WSZ10320.1 glycoside hydrolase family 3 C-terminal domain-containing protein [Streptomyces sp. NBC_00869]WSZ22177.1 glycoside hydrolase family 3 C-terminal domain-containing protein [Streptomyces sp. NBC_00870]
MTQRSAPSPSPAAALPLAEKAALTSGSGDFVSQGSEAAGIPAVRMSDGPHGLRLPRESGDGGQLDLHSAGPATCFPPAVALGSSWNPELAEEVAGAIAAEAVAHGVHVVLGPGINIKRSPLCGRNFEYFSEDPLVSSELGGAMVRGLQNAGVGASLKHYAANNQETDRMRVSADIDERPLREIYLRAFERVVRRDSPWSVMASYNGVNGVPVSQNTRLLTGILREEWEFDGIVVSDWGAVRDRVAALRAGLDLQMPGPGGRTDREVAAAVESGALDEALLDRTVDRLALFAQRATGGSGTPGTFDADASHRIAGRAADQCVVLLKNDDALLPLDPASGSVAVIGEFARTPRFQGAGSSQVTPTRLDVPLDGLRELATGADVRFAAGYTLPGAEDGPSDAELADEAVRLAEASDTAVLFLGLPPQDESEGFDRDHLDLPAAQTKLLRRVLEANPRAVVVLSNGGVVRTSPWQDRVPALVEGWLLGQAGGGALARVLFGAVNPSGKLAETVPLRLEDSPSHLTFPGEEGRARYGEGVFVGYRGYDAQRREVAFPFGHGLSYTTFDYADLAVREDGDGFRVTLAVTNTGSVAGREVVQIYVAGPDGSRVLRPVRELRGFASVSLEPGASREVEVRVARHDLAYFSEREGGWKVEGGRYRFEAGASSRDIRARVETEVEGDPSGLRLTGRNTLAEWFEHPVGGPLLMEAFAKARTDSAQEGAGALADPVMRRFLAGVPLDVICEFPQSPLSPEALPALADEVEARTAAAL